MLEIHSLSELLGVFGAQLVSEGQNLQAGLNVNFLLIESKYRARKKWQA